MVTYDSANLANPFFWRHLYTDPGGLSCSCKMVFSRSQKRGRKHFSNVESVSGPNGNKSRVSLIVILAKAEIHDRTEFDTNSAPGFRLDTGLRRYDEVLFNTLSCSFGTGVCDSSTNIFICNTKRQ